jgi:hypothetical protein
MTRPWIIIKAVRGDAVLAWYRGKDRSAIALCTEQWKRLWPDASIIVRIGEPCAK